MLSLQEPTGLGRKKVKISVNNEQVESMKLTESESTHLTAGAAVKMGYLLSFEFFILSSYLTS